VLREQLGPVEVVDDGAEARRRLVRAGIGALWGPPVIMVALAVLNGGHWHLSGWSTIWLALLIACVAGSATAYAGSSSVGLGLMAGTSLAIGSLLRGGPGGILGVVFALASGVVGGAAGFAYGPLRRVPDGAVLLRRMTAWSGGAMALLLLGATLVSPSTHASELDQIANNPYQTFMPRHRQTVDTCSLSSVPEGPAGKVAVHIAGPHAVARGTKPTFTTSFTVNDRRWFGVPARRTSFDNVFIVVHPVDWPTPLYGWALGGGPIGGLTGGSAAASGDADGVDGILCGGPTPSSRFSATALPGHYQAEAVVEMAGLQWRSAPITFEVR
jgi:hypothetical protein